MNGSPAGSGSSGGETRVDVVDGSGTPRAIAGHRAKNWRVAFYSHDTMGLGHLRRNLLAAYTLSQSHPRVICLLVAGVREAGAFPLPAGTDSLLLPSLRKDEGGQYQSRNLGVSLPEVIALRAGAIDAAVEAFDPDVMIVDNVPRGAMRELDPALTRLRAKGRARCVLGLRDILDEPSVVRREWAKAENEQAIDEYYDEIWVYADCAVYDVVRECQLPPRISAKVRFAGYLDQRVRLQLASECGMGWAPACELPAGKFVLCSVGGGQDGALLAETFAHAELPPEASGLILAGPFMPRDLLFRLRAIAAANPRMHVVEFCPEPAWLVKEAERVIIMGGYNSVCEALSFEKPALIVPRVKPRVEQLIRARRLHHLGLVDVLHPAQLTPRALSRWMVEDRQPPRVHDRLDFNGLSAVPSLLERLLARPAKNAAVIAV